MRRAGENLRQSSGLAESGPIAGIVRGVQISLLFWTAGLLIFAVLW